MHWGARQPLALLVAIPPFALFAFLVIAGKGTETVQLAALGVAATLALVGLGLRPRKVKIDSVDIEFEGPEDPDE